jgi:UDP-N-acetylmuramate--alanine ligase
VKRRFEYIIKTDSTVMIDDYAHHPQELETLIISAKKLYPNKKCLIVFQPHLFTRTRDFAEGFSKALGLADEIILLPIYPAREKPIEGITSEMLADLMINKNLVCTSKNDLLDIVLQKENVELIIMAGAGDIDTLIEPIKDILINKN